MRRVETLDYKNTELITKFKINETQKFLIIVQHLSVQIILVNSSTVVQINFPEDL